MRQPDTLKLLSFDFFIYSSSETKPRLSKMQIFPGIFWNLWNFGMLHIYKTSIQSFQFICIYISDACNPIVVDLQHCLAYFHQLIWWGLSHWVKWMDWRLYDGDLRHERVKNLYLHITVKLI